MKCPMCSKEMQTHDELGLLCNTDNCPLYQVWFDSDDIKVIAQTVEAARRAGYEEAREQVAVCIRLTSGWVSIPGMPHKVSTWELTDIVLEQTALLPQPAAAAKDNLALLRGQWAHGIVLWLESHPDKTGKDALDACGPEPATDAVPSDICPSCQRTGTLSGPGKWSLCTACQWSGVRA